MNAQGKVDMASASKQAYRTKLRSHVLINNLGIYSVSAGVAYTTRKPKRYAHNTPWCGW